VGERQDIPGGNAGISITASRDVEVYDNILAWNEVGISVVNSLREANAGGTDPKLDTVSNVLVHDNTILAQDIPPAGDDTFPALAWRKTYPEGNLYDPAANNRGLDNRYWYLNPEVTFVRFVWERDFKRLRVFNCTPGEENGRYLTDRRKIRWSPPTISRRSRSRESRRLEGRGISRPSGTYQFASFS
jgi:hypothetical protein